MNAQEQNDPWRLEIFWFEPPGNDRERLQTCCGEILGSVSKLNFVRLQLEEAVEKENLDAAFDYI